VTGDWGEEKKEALEQPCFSFAPRNLLVEPAPLKREKKIFVSHQNMFVILSSTSCAKVLLEKKNKFLPPNQMADYCSVVRSCHWWTR